MEREKILEMYLAEVQAELADETPSLLFIRGLTKFCNTMLEEAEKNVRAKFEPITLTFENVKTEPMVFKQKEPEPQTLVFDENTPGQPAKHVSNGFVSYQYRGEEPDDTDRGRGRRHWLSDSEVQRIKNLRDTGKSIAEIVRITGFSRATVCRKLSGYLPKSNKEPGKGHIDWFRDLAAQGMGIKAISDRTGYTEAVVEKYIGGKTHENADT